MNLQGLPRSSLVWCLSSNYYTLNILYYCRLQVEWPKVWFSFIFHSEKKSRISFSPQPSRSRFSDILPSLRCAPVAAQCTSPPPPPQGTSTHTHLWALSTPPGTAQREAPPPPAQRTRLRHQPLATIQLPSAPPSCACACGAPSVRGGQYAFGCGPYGPPWLRGEGAWAEDPATTPSSRGFGVECSRGQRAHQGTQRAFYRSVCRVSADIGALCVY